MIPYEYVGCGDAWLEDGMDDPCVGAMGCVPCGAAAACAAATATVVGVGVEADLAVVVPCTEAAASMLWDDCFSSSISYIRTKFFETFSHEPGSKNT